MPRLAPAPVDLAKTLSSARQLLIFQIQFLSTLRLLEANISAPFRRMMDQLKWLNLHFRVDLGFAGCDDGQVRPNVQE